MRSFGPVVALLLFSGIAQAQYPDNPSPHRFFDRTAVIAFAASTAVRSADIAVTCHNLANGRRELWLPTQSCRGVSLYLGASVGAQFGVAYLLHRWHHPRMERIAEFAGAAPSAAGIIKTLSGRGDKKAPPPASTPQVVIGTQVQGFCIVGQTC